MASAAVHFGPFTLLPGEQRLLRGGTEVPLGPRAFGMLCVLAQRPGQLVSKDELLETVWHGLVVEEANLHVQVSQLRKAIGAETVITVPGRGYRFALPVIPVMQVVPVATDLAAQAAAAALAVSPAAAQAGPEPQAAQAPGADAKAAPPPLRRLSVIVLPFVESGAPPEQEYFADAITDDVTTQLSKIRGSTVIGSPTALAHKRERFDVAALARELGVRYVLQGRLERSEEGAEANVRLSDAATGAVVWSDAIDVPKTGVFQLRRELVARLAHALGLELIAAEAGRSRAEPAGHAQADDLVMQAMAAGGAAWSPDRVKAAIGLCDQALRLQPEHAPALALRASGLVGLAAGWPGPDEERLIAQADTDITRSLALDSLAAFSHNTLARVRQLQFRLDAALAAVEQALQLNPNSPASLGFKGRLIGYCGKPEHALDPVHRALTLSPRDPERFVWLFQIGAAHLFLGQYELALAWLEKSMVAMPYWRAARFQVAAFAHLGRMAESRAAHARWQKLIPVPLAEAARTRTFARDSNNETYLALLREHAIMGLVKAGLSDAPEYFEAYAAFQRSGGKL